MLSGAVNAIGITLLLGGAISAYLWLVRRPKLEVEAGIRTLAAMRWREFSRFVIEALHAQGFEASRVEPKAESGQQADLLLNRDDQTWLLSCKQGANYRITQPQVGAMAKAVREAGAGGGIIATLGQVDPGARQQANGIELLDGAALWPLIEPLLPPSLHQDLADRARVATLRMMRATWIGSLLAGIALALLIPAPGGGAEDLSPVSAPVAAAITPAPTASANPAAEAGIAPAAPAPVSEMEEREEVIRAISSLPGIERALWSTRSTLHVFLADDVADEAEVAELCRILERYENLRASRLQLQPVAGSARPVRFMQCRAY